MRTRQAEISIQHCTKGIRVHVPGLGVGAEFESKVGCRASRTPSEVHEQRILRCHAAQTIIKILYALIRAGREILEGAKWLAGSHGCVDLVDQLFRCDHMRALSGASGTPPLCFTTVNRWELRHDCLE